MALPTGLAFALLALVVRMRTEASLATMASTIWANIVASTSATLRELVADFHSISVIAEWWTFAFALVALVAVVPTLAGSGARRLRLLDVRVLRSSLSCSLEGRLRKASSGRASNSSTSSMSNTATNALAEDTRNRR